MQTKHHLEEDLKRLRLPGLAMNLDLRLKEASESKLGYLDFLTLLVQDEVANREGNNLVKRIKAAGFGISKTFEGFDFHFNAETFPSSLVRDLASCRFVMKKQNLVIAGPPGIGKTHIVKAVGHEICRRGSDVIFRKTHKLLSGLVNAITPRHMERQLKKYVKAELLILDDFAFRKFDQKESELLYAICDERMGKSSTVITSNRPPEDWYSVFPDPVIGGAILDRLVSGAVKIVVTKGRSFRKEGLTDQEKKVDEQKKY